MGIQHKHLMLNLHVNRVTPKDATNDLTVTMNYIVEKILGMQICMPLRSVFIDQEGNKGMTYQAGLVTSHLAGHEWSEPDIDGLYQVQFDVYTCGCLTVGQAEKVRKILSEYYGGIEYGVMLLMERGKTFVEEYHHTFGAII